MILMDDGFQNPAIAKDASLIVIDGDRGLGNGRVFPAGPLRAPLPPQLARTDALIIVGDGSRRRRRSRPRIARAGQACVAGASHARRRLGCGAARQTRLAFAGIGDPPRFFRTLRACGIDVVAERAFADHHPFSEGEIAAADRRRKRDGLTLVTTEKDLARLRNSREFAAFAQTVVPFAVTLEFDDEAMLRTFVTDRCFRRARRRIQRSTKPCVFSASG